MKKIYSTSKDIISDTITPIGALLNLRDLYANVSLFESSDYHSKEKSRSFICIDPILTITVKNEDVRIDIEGKQKTVEVKELEFQIPELFGEFEFVDEKVRAFNGFFGAVSYDSIPTFETIQFKEKSKYLDLPEIYFSAYRYIIVFDNFKNQAKIISNSFQNEGFNLSDIENALKRNVSSDFNFSAIGASVSNETEDSFAKKVLLAKDHILKGDVFQLVLSRAFEQSFKGDDFEVYRQLRGLNPSPYMFYFDMNTSKLIGASPEAQIKISDHNAEIHPIAGTVKRSGDEKRDQEAIATLNDDAKENAEHTMLVDLARNDLNITCQNVEVAELKKMQSFSHVIHMVSKVVGEVEKNKEFSAFSRSFPAGTLSGAPKYKAMELIDLYEKDNRGFYGGAIGHISPDGDINMAIIIRSCLSYKKKLYYQAGAGVVLDSIPENESKEVLNKIGAVAQAIQLANCEL